MINSFTADWRKLRQRPSVWILGAMMLVALLLFAYIIPWLQLWFPSSTFRPNPGQTIDQMKAALYPINFVKNSLSAVGIVGSILTLILGALVAGSEFSWGTVKTVYAQRPGRLQTLAGQLGVVSVIAAVFTVAFYLVAAMASVIIALGNNVAITWPAAIDILKALGATWLIFESWSLFGIALAYLFKQSAMAIGLGLAYVLAIEGIVVRLLGGFNIGWVTTVEKALLGQNANSLIQSLGQIFVAPGTPAPLVSAGQAVLVLAIYGVAFAAIASLVVRTRDIG
jgi:ABC-type transport system involved in multi-copper enzyme maturation permease subunit